MPLRSSIATLVRDVATALLPNKLRRRLRSVQRRYGLHTLPLGSVDFGDLRRVAPISPIFGIDRDLLSVERHYIEEFLQSNSAHIRGRVLEMGDPAYTVKFGGDRVTQSDVLHYVEGNPKATIVGDLTAGKTLPDAAFDCIILTQTLQMIFDAHAAIRTLHRILKPGGVVLATSHGISRIARREGVDDWGEYWHFTAQSTKKLFEEQFLPENTTIMTYGNVLSAVGSLHGLAASELKPNELAHRDPNYELLISVCARKEAAPTHAP